MITRTAVDHPTWCSAPHCRIDEAAGEHRSTPVSHRTTAGDAEITVQRYQHEAAGESRYQAAITHLEVAEQVTIDLTDDDAVMVFSLFGLLRDGARTGSASDRG